MASNLTSRSPHRKHAPNALIADHR
jgi:hypothetical protein